MAFDREAAKAEGYSDDEINAYLQAEAEKKKQTAPAVDVGEPPAPQTKIDTVGTSPEAMATTAGIGLAPYAVPAAGVAAAALGGGKVYQGWKSGVDAANKYTATQAQNAATHAATQEMKTLQQIAKGTGPEADAARQRLTQLIQSRGGAPMPTGAPVSGPVNPNAGAQAFNQMGQQLRTPPVNAGYSGPKMQANAVSELESLFSQVPEGKLPLANPPAAGKILLAANALNCAITPGA